MRCTRLDKNKVRFARAEQLYATIIHCCKPMIDVHLQYHGDVTVVYAIKTQVPTAGFDARTSRAYSQASISADSMGAIAPTTKKLWGPSPEEFCYVNFAETVLMLIQNCKYVIVPVIKVAQMSA